MKYQSYLSIFILFLIFLNISKVIAFESPKAIYKCGKNQLKIKPQPAKNPIKIDHNSLSFRRKLDLDGFKDFHIYVDFTNIEKEIEINNLSGYKDMFISSINKAVATLQKLLKVKPLKNSYNFEDSFLKRIGLNYWDTSKFGDEATEKGITTETLDIDLIIFGKFLNKTEIGNNTLASATFIQYEEGTGQPIAGIININKDLDYSLVHTQEYFQSIVLHEFTHILGFDIYLFFNFFKNIILKRDTYNIARHYINSKRVISVAEKYFNCNKVIGIELEERDFETAGSHWESRILLGDYMNSMIYKEEQVISEFTLALLEDIGFYKANYYTGGLMRYGKNKGCKFLNDQCVTNNEINSNFENEFFDYFSQNGVNTPSCSSGRQSRTYNILWEYNSKITTKYQYYNHKYLGGLPTADYCPVSHSHPKEEEINSHYVGHCSNKGSGEYGSLIAHYNTDTNTISYYKSNDLESILGEKYSDNSFCYLSSLVKNTKSNYEFYSKTVRAVCFETFCSSKSLTVKINEDYIVCPRAGGKINVTNYEGYLLCPDYNLICSGTVLCNDLFDCVEKGSTIKKDGYKYDYEIKTSQNIAKAGDEEADNLNNYELSDNGKCPKYCKLCFENRKCLECKNNYVFVRKVDEETIKCVSSNDLSVGYYKVGELYYECIDNCDTCSDGYTCNSCNEKAIYLFNKCIQKIENCQEYNEDGTCKICEENYAFIGEDRLKCINRASLYSYYSIDNGFSYYECSGKGENQIKYCNKCHYNESLICDECIKNYYLENKTNECIPFMLESKRELIFKKKYLLLLLFYIYLF